MKFWFLILMFQGTRTRSVETRVQLLAAFEAHDRQAAVLHEEELKIEYPKVYGSFDEAN